jgi:serine/threonine-protein kinase
VPSVLGLSLEAAERSLRAAGFRTGDVDRRVSGRPEGSVIDQRPGPGEPAPAGSRVDLVAAAPAPVAGDIKVPNVEGDPEDEAVQELRKRRLVARVRRQQSCERLGRVIAQEPRKDSRVPEGSEVTITVASAGDRPVKVPNVERLPRARAEASLRKSGLVVGRVRSSPTSSAEPDQVLDQQPESGQLVAPGCAVELTIAEREPVVRVPDFRGMAEKEALSRLRSSTTGLTLGRVSGGGSGGKVVKQEPEAGAQVPRGSAVSLWIQSDTRPDPPRDRVLVPNVRGRALKSAVDTIRGSGLSTSVQGRGACVVDQRPPGKAWAERGSAVTLYAGACPIQ